MMERKRGVKERDKEDEGENERQRTYGRKKYNKGRETTTRRI